MPGFTAHALRRTYRTGLRELSVDSDLAELMVGHTRPGLQRLYDRSELIEMRREAQARWEAFVAEEAGL